MVKRNVFLTYHHADQQGAYNFVASFKGSFNAMRAVGVSDNDDFVDSTNTDYVLRCIRENYISGTSATIVLVGECSWSRKYVDWEIAATLRNNPIDPRGALLAIQLRHIVGRKNVQLPARLALNRQYDNQSDMELGYASCHTYPRSGPFLAQLVEDAITRRDNTEPAPGSTSNLRKKNSPC